MLGEKVFGKYAADGNDNPAVVLNDSAHDQNASLL
jgi:hypothetical protein